MRNNYRIIQKPLNSNKDWTITRLPYSHYGETILAKGKARTLMILQRAKRKRVRDSIVWKEIARREGTQGRVIYVAR